MKLRLPKSVLARGVRWEFICYTRGSGQYPGGNKGFTGAKPPGLIVPCADGTAQFLELDLPEELVREDDYVRERRGKKA